MAPRAALMGRQLWLGWKDNQQGEGSGKQCLLPPPPPPLRSQNEWKGEQLLPECFYFPFPLVLFFTFFFFSFGAKPYFLTVWLTLSFPFCVLDFHRHLPDSFFSEREVGVCQERIECHSRFRKGSGIQEGRTQLESSQAPRGKSRKEAWLPKEREFAETGKPGKNRYILERQYIESERIQKSMCTGKNKQTNKLGLNISQQVGQREEMPHL